MDELLIGFICIDESAMLTALSFIIFFTLNMVVLCVFSPRIGLFFAVPARRTRLRAIGFWSLATIVFSDLFWIFLKIEGTNVIPWADIGGVGLLLVWCLSLIFKWRREDPKKREIPPADAIVTVVSGPKLNGNVVN